MADLWSDKTVFAHLGHLEAASVTYEVTADFTKPLAQAYTLKITLRALGVWLGDVTASPIKDGNISISVAQPIGGAINGRIDNWTAIDASGTALPNTDDGWKSAAAVSFLVTALGNLAIPVSQIVALVPTLGPLLRAAAALLGSAVTVNIGHKAVTIPVHRDADGAPVQP